MTTYRPLFSDDGMYRYRMDCDLGLDGPKALFIGLMPSSHRVDRHTNYAMFNGYEAGFSKVMVGNLLSVRSKYTKQVPVDRPSRGPDHWKHLQAMADEADIIIPVWGSRKQLQWCERGIFGAMIDWVVKLDKPVWLCGILTEGDPKKLVSKGRVMPIDELPDRQWGMRGGFFTAPLRGR